MVRVLVEPRWSGVDGGRSEEGEESRQRHQSVEQAQPHQQHHHLAAVFVNITILSKKRKEHLEECADEHVVVQGKGSHGEEG